MTPEGLATLLTVLDLCGVAVFAFSGALAAARAQMDILGFVLVGTATGIGGGTIRDLLMDVGPVFWLTELNYLAAAAGAALAAFFIGDRFNSRLKVLLWADALGLALFCGLGAKAALSAGFGPVVGTVMGLVTATFGGVLRDVLCNETPLLMRKEVYGIAALAGAGTFVTLHEIGIDETAALGIGIATALVLRGLAIIFDWSPPFSTWTRRPPRNQR